MANRQTIVFDVKTEISQVKQSAQEMKSIFDRMDLSDSIKKSFLTTFNKLEKEIRDFEVTANKGLNSLSDAKGAERSVSRINDLFEDLKIQMKDTQKFKLDKIVSSDTAKKLKDFKKALEQVTKLQQKDNSSNIQKAQDKVTNALEKKKKAQDAYNTSLANEKQLQSRQDQVLDDLQKESDAIDKLSERLAQLKAIQNRNGSEQAEFNKVNVELQSLTKAYKKHWDEVYKLDDQLKNLGITNQNLANDMTAAEQKYNNCIIKLQEAKNASGITTKELQNLKNMIAELNGQDSQKLPDDLNELEKKLLELDLPKKTLEEINTSFQQMKGNAEQAGAGIKKFESEVKKGTDALQSFKDINSQMDQLKSRLSYFFSAMNGFQLFKRAIRDAYNSIKELDAAMTEMAVVTDYSIGDIWGQIKNYTTEANELGATTKDVINSMVLYTQQGLEMSEATQLSTETMKMARIAGLEGAEATDLMTAALRGFNMELNETSAQRVNDVYSNLAANAAANTQEIANAMTRTASIANSAGMEFETTAAFLTQMIETTRESAENLGTAMKTIVARFTEMKKAPNEILNVDGEEVNANKVEEALKSVGVQLRDTTGEFRDLDDVFLELSSKWDSLDKMSQRYVATMAAGSRQQSRFIAMMDNYQRTLELTSFANNSAGASQLQFNKTLDSLESKLNRLHNAWEQFITGIGNQTVIKGIIDSLTNLLTVINNITESLDPAGIGWAKLIATILSFKAAKGIVGGVLKNIGNQLGTRNNKTNDNLGTNESGTENRVKGEKDGAAYGKGFWGAFQKISAQKKDFKATRPITYDLKNSKQQAAEISKEISLLKDKSKIYASQGKEYSQLTARYKAYTKSLQDLHAKTLYKNAGSSKANGVVLAENRALQAKEQILRSTLSAESEAYAASIARTEQLKAQEAALLSNNSAMQKGEAIEFAKTAANNTNTASEAANTAAIEAGNAATEQEAALSSISTGATDADTIATEANNMTKLQAIAGLFSLNANKRLAAATSLGLMTAEEAEAIATEGATAAQTGFNAALYACPIMWIIAGIAALIAGIAQLIWWLNQSDSETEKFKKESEETEAALKGLNEQISQTKNSIENLKSSWDSLQDLTSELNNLTVGTTQWKQKLLEVNQQVIELVDKYPQLAKYMHNNNGVLTIDSQGYDQLIEDQTKGLQSQNIAKSFVTVDKRQQEIDAIDRSMTNDFNSETNFGKIARMMGLKKHRNFTQAQVEEANANKGSKQLEIDTNLELGISALIDNYVSDQEEVGNILSQEKVQLAKTALLNQQTYENFKKIEKETDANTSTYARLTGLSEDEVKQKLENNEINEKMIKSAIAAYKFQDLYGEQIKEALDLNTAGLSESGLRALQGNNTFAKHDLSKVYLGEFDKYIKNGKVDLSNVNNQEIQQIKDQLLDFGITENDIAIAEKAGATLEQIIQNAVNGEASLERLNTHLSYFDDNTKKIYTNFTNNLQDTLGKDLSVAQEEKIASIFSKVINQGGDIEAFSKNLDEIIANFKDPEDLNNFLESFQNADFSSSTSIRNFLDQLNTINPDNINFGEKIKKEITTSANAVQDFDMSKVREELLKTSAELIGDTITRIKENNKIYTEEEMNEAKAHLVELGRQDLADKFVQRVDKWVYNGDLEELQNAYNATELNKDAIKLAEEDKKEVARKKREKERIINNNRAPEELEADKTAWEYLAEKDNISESDVITKYVTDYSGATGMKKIDISSKEGKEQNYLNSLLYKYDEKGNQLDEYDSDKIAKIMKRAQTDYEFAETLPKEFITEALNYMNELQENGDQKFYNMVEYIQGINNMSGDDAGKYFDEIKTNVEDLYTNSFKATKSWESHTEQQAQYNKNFLKQFVDAKIITEETAELWKNLSVDEMIEKLNKLDISENEALQSAADNYAKNAYTMYDSAIKIVELDPLNDEMAKSQEKALDGLITTHEGYEERLKALQREYGLTELAAKKYLAVQYEQNSVVDGIVSTLSDNEDILKDENIAAMKGTDKYNELIASLTKQFKLIMGEDITSEWVENNITEIKKLTEGEEDAKAALEKLYSTSEAKAIKIKVEVEGNKNGEIDNEIYNNVQSYFSDLEDTADASKTDITTNVGKIKEQIEKLNKSDVDIQVKANTLAALAELIKLGMVKAMVADKPNEFLALWELARDSGFSVKGLNKVMSATVVNGKVSYSFSDSESAISSILSVQARKLTKEQEFRATGSGQTGDDDDNDNGSSSKNEWTNDYDDQYNVLKRIEAIERERTKLEKQQNRLTRQRYIDEEKLMANKKEQVEVLKRQAAINKQLLNDSLANLNAHGNGDVWFDPNSGTLQTNPNAINYNEEQMKAFNTQKTFMEKWYETLKSSQDNLEEIYDSIEELTKTVDFSSEDLSFNIEKTIGVIDNTLTNLEREISRADRYDSHVTAQQLTRLYKQSMQSNTDKYNQLTEQKAVAEAQLNSKIHSKYGKYYEYDWDTKKLNLTDDYYNITDEQLKESVDQERGVIDDLSQTVIDIDNQQEEIKDAQYELKEALLDKRLEFEEKIYDAVVHNREEQIENLKNLDESIKNASSELISSVQKNLQKLRQDRQNQKTEEELQDMEVRLSYLQVDTSTGNQKSILDLQKQLTEKQQSYTDSLIDQKITELQQQNDEAAAQRKKQIEIMEAQLDLDKVNGVIWQNVNKAILQGVDTTGKIQKDSELYVILSSLDEVTKKNATQFERWFGELSNLAAYYRVDYDEAVSSMNQTSDTISNPNDVYGENSAYIKSLKNRLEQMSRDGNFNHLMWYDQENQRLHAEYEYVEFGTQAEADAYNQKWAEYQALAQELANARAFYEHNKDRSFISAFKRTNKYDSGGLADYTGLAWLDGTPSSPELVLNRRDTENFIQLKDILADVMTGNSNGNKTNGDFYFEVHIDVDKISNDYDVDKIAERIKQQISNEARKRNVNTINMIR